MPPTLENPRATAYTEAELLEAGFIWIRDDQPWGICPTYWNPVSKEVRFHLKGKYVTRQLIEVYLRTEWFLESAEENTWKWTVINELDWNKAGTPPTPKTPEELRLHLAELYRVDKNLSARLQNPNLDSTERLQTLEALLNNMGLIMGIKWALGAA